MSIPPILLIPYQLVGLADGLALSVGVDSDADGLADSSGASSVGAVEFPFAGIPAFPMLPASGPCRGLPNSSLSTFEKV